MTVLAVRLGCGKAFPGSSDTVMVRGVQQDAGGVCAIKDERVCRLVPPGVRTCSPFEEGIRHSWMGVLVVHPLGWGLKGVRGGQPARLPHTTRGQLF